MADTPQDVVNRELREFRRYTGDGLPGEPVNAPLPVGDPQSGVHNPKKVNLRKAMLAPVEAAAQSASDAKDEADRAGGEADRAQLSADSAALSSAAAGAASGRLDVASFAELATKFVYSDPGPGQEVVAEGDVILWREEGFAYKVAGAGATDAHLDYSGEGGVKLRLLKTQDGAVSTVAAGVPETGDASSQINILLAGHSGIIDGGNSVYEIESALSLTGPGQVFRNVEIEATVGGGNPAIVMGSGYSGGKVSDLKVTSDSHIIGTTNTDLTDLLISQVRFNADRYAILTNDSGTGSTADGLIISDSFIHSETSDAIEFNNYLGLSHNFLTHGVVLSTGLSGTSPSAGFAYGNAGIQYSVLSGAIVKESRRTAVHIEDRQKGTVVNAISAHGLRDHGIAIYNQGVTGGAQSARDGVVVNAGHFTFEGSDNSGHYGTYVTYDSMGALPMNVVSSSYFKGFDHVLDLGGSTGLSPDKYIHQLMDNIVGDGAEVGVYLHSPAQHHGDVLLRNTPILATVAPGSHAGNIYSVSPVTEIAAYNELYPANDIGGSIEGFDVPVLINHVSGNVSHNLFPLGTRVLGTIEVDMLGLNRFWLCARIKWDGSVLTLEDFMKREKGAAGSVALNQSGGILRLNMNSPTASLVPCNVRFRGIWYKEG